MARSKTGTRHRDSDPISNESYEIEYIHQQFPDLSHTEGRDALSTAKAELKNQRTGPKSWVFSGESSARARTVLSAIYEKAFFI